MVRAASYEKQTTTVPELTLPTVQRYQARNLVSAIFKFHVFSKVMKSSASLPTSKRGLCTADPWSTKQTLRHARRGADMPIESMSKIQTLSLTFDQVSGAQ